MFLRQLASNCVFYQTRVRTCLLFPKCSATSTTSMATSASKIPSFSRSEERNASKVAMKFALSQYRPSKTKQWAMKFTIFWNLMKYRLFEDRKFRMRAFRQAARTDITLVAAKLLAQDFNGLKELMTPEAISNIKKQMKDDKQLQRMLANVALNHENLILREKLFDADFSSIALNDGNTKRAFEITLLYFCRVKQDSMDRSKVMTLLKSNPFGGKDEVKGTLPVDAYIFAAVWMTLAKSLEKGSDWRVIRYDPSPAFIRRKDVEEHS